MYSIPPVLTDGIDQADLSQTYIEKQNNFYLFIYLFFLMYSFWLFILVSWLKFLGYHFIYLGYKLVSFLLIVVS